MPLWLVPPAWPVFQHESNETFIYVNACVSASEYAPLQIVMRQLNILRVFEAIQVACLGRCGWRRVFRCGREGAGGEGR